MLRVEALVEADATVKAITEASDADTKRIRLAFRKLFSGSFNKISNDPQTMDRAVITILDGGAETFVEQVSGVSHGPLIVASGADELRTSSNAVADGGRVGAATPS